MTNLKLVEIGCNRIRIGVITISFRRWQRSWWLFQLYLGEEEERIGSEEAVALMNGGVLEILMSKDQLATKRSWGFLRRGSWGPKSSEEVKEEVHYYVKKISLCPPPFANTLVIDKNEIWLPISNNTILIFIITKNNYFYVISLFF